MSRFFWLLVVLLVIGLVPSSCRQDRLTVASKKFTESVILGEVIQLAAEAEGIPLTHYQELGGTQIIFQGLRSGDIDLYPDYTGTLANEILRNGDLDETGLRRELADMGIMMSRPLGFNNSYAIGMKRSKATQLGITKISQLAQHPDLICRFSHEFVERADGWGPLRERYGLPQTNVRGVDHDVAYRQLDSEVADVIDVYTTDSKLRVYDILVLQDDRSYFSRYDCVILFRDSLQRDSPELIEAIRQLEGLIDQQQMIDLNKEVELLERPERQVASEFLREQLGIEVKVRQVSTAEQIGRRTKEHLDLVRRSLAMAILFAIPLGIVAAKQRQLGQGILIVVSIVQTIPGLALLVMLIAPAKKLGLDSIGTGSAPVMIALFLYSLLPIVRNTYAGLSGIPNSLRESADALGMNAVVKLWKVELPLAMPTILAGIKTAAVINVGFATLGALIGAGGYGQPILAGIRLANNELILQGAIPAAVLAMIVQWGFDLVERVMVSPGLRS